MTTKANAAIKIEKWDEQTFHEATGAGKLTRVSVAKSYADHFVPEGRRENSPAFQRWVGCQKISSPEGTVEIGITDLIFHSAVPSGLTFFTVQPSVKTLGYFQMSPPGQPQSRLWN